MAGGFTINELLSFSDIEIPVFGKLETLIRAQDPNLLAYTQASAGLAIGVAVLGIVLAITVFLRVCKFKSGGAGTALLCVVINFVDSYPTHIIPIPTHTTPTYIV